MEGRRAEMVFTDPPYNDPIDGCVNEFGKLHHPEFAVASREMSEPEFTDFLTNVLAQLAPNSGDGAVQFICMDWRHSGELISAARSIRAEFKNLCVWVKDNAGQGSLYTQLIQELVSEGMHAIKKYEPTIDKIMRMHSVTSTIENGFAHLPDKAAWLGEYLHELISFPNGKYDDQADSTSQALDWFKQQSMTSPNWFLESYKRDAERLKAEEASGSDLPLTDVDALIREWGRRRFPILTLLNGTWSN